jgi:hypothetical protein
MQAPQDGQLGHRLLTTFLQIVPRKAQHLLVSLQRTASRRSHRRQRRQRGQKGKIQRRGTIDPTPRQMERLQIGIARLPSEMGVPIETLEGIAGLPLGRRWLLGALGE